MRSQGSPPVVVLGGGSGDTAIEVPCIIRPRTVVRIKSEISGRVETIHVAPGDAVEEGALLAEIDTHGLEIELARVRLAQARTASRMEVIRLQLERAKRTKSVMQEAFNRSVDAAGAEGGFLATGSHSELAVEMASRGAELRDATLTSQDLLLQAREIRRKMDLAKLRAPLAGTVLARTAEEGAIVGSGTSQFGGGDVLFEIGDMGTLKAECFARESQAWSMRQGLPVQVVADAPNDRIVDAAITHVAPAVDLISGAPRLKFEVEFSRPDPSWRVGINAIVRLVEASEAAALRLPLSAVDDRAGHLFARVRRGAHFEVVPISGRREQTGWLVSAGLERGDLVAKDFSQESAVGE
jgi:multidrug efflux pump subunit AcrA (membrane-fusion protein)